MTTFENAIEEIKNTDLNKRYDKAIEALKFATTKENRNHSA